MKRLTGDRSMALALGQCPYFKICCHDDNDDRHHHQTLLTTTENFPAGKAAGDVILPAHLHPAPGIRM